MRKKLSLLAALLCYKVKHFLLSFFVQNRNVISYLILCHTA